MKRTSEYADYLRLQRIWNALPATPMTEERLRDAIIAADGLYPGAWAEASVVALEFRSGGAIVAAIDENGVRMSTKAKEFPAFVDHGPGSPAFNAALAAMGAEERARFDRGQAIAKANREVVHAPEKLMEKRAIDERVDARLRELGLLPVELNSAAA